MATIFPAAYGEPELTLDFSAAALAAFPVFVGHRPAFFMSLADSNNVHPGAVHLVLKAALIGGGMAAAQAEGTIDRLRRRSESPIRRMVVTALSEALAAA